MPDEIEVAIDEHRQLVGPIPKMGEPFDVAHHRVELVAMKYQHFATIDQLVGRFFHDVDAAEIFAHISTQEFIMIAGNINDVRALPDFPQQFLDYDIVERWPVPDALKPPAIDNIAHQKNGFGVIMLEQVEQLLGLAAAGSEMNVGNE